MFDTEVMLKYPASVRAGMARSAPLQRTGAAAERAWLVALLASPLGGALSGSTVTFDCPRDDWFGPWPPAGLVDESGEVPVRSAGKMGLRAGEVFWLHKSLPSF